MTDAPLQCPRCGYTLLANVATTDEQVGVEGDDHSRCTECGLDFEWSDLRSHHQDPVWFVESRVSRHSLARRALETLVVCCRPFFFWSRVRMNLPLRNSGLVAFVLAIALLAHATTSVGRVYANRLQSWRSQTHALDYAYALIYPLSRYNASDIVDADSLLGDHDTLRLATALVRGLTADKGLTIHATIHGQIKGVPVGASALKLLSHSAQWRLLTSALTPLGAPLALLLLPISLRMARVRKAHLVRACVYSFILLIPCLALAIHATLTHWSMTLGMVSWRGRLEPHALTMLAAALTLPWMFALTSRYLKLPHAFPVALACTTIAMLASLGAAALVFGSL